MRHARGRVRRAVTGESGNTSALFKVKEIVFKLRSILKPSFCNNGNVYFKFFKTLNEGVYFRAQ